MKKTISLLTKIFAVLGIISTSILLILIGLNQKYNQNVIEIKNDAGLLIQKAEQQFMLDTIEVYHNQICYDIRDLEKDNLNNDRSLYIGSVLVKGDLDGNATGYIFLKYNNLKAEGQLNAIDIYESDYGITTNCFGAF